jgi:hypothetical protein
MILIVAILIEDNTVVSMNDHSTVLWWCWVQCCWDHGDVDGPSVVFHGVADPASAVMVVLLELVLSWWCCSSWCRHGGAARAGTVMVVLLKLVLS